MKKGIFTLSVLSLLLSQASNAEYMIKIPLEPKSIQFNDAEVAGSIELTPSTINRGESATINWDYTFANSINIEDIGQFTNKNGYVLVNPLTSRSYNVEIKNGDKIRNEVLNLTVIQPNQNISFNASPTRIGIGQTSVLDWNVSNSYGVRISNINDNNLPLVGSYTVSPTTSTSYVLTAKGYEGINDTTQTVNIEVVPNAVISSFETDKSKITTGDSVIFSWNVANAESLALNPFGPLVQRVSGNQSIPFNTAGSFVYTLEATSLSGEKDTRTRTIEVFNPATINTFNAPIEVFSNSPFNLSWTATGANRYTLKSNNANSGITVAEENLETALTKTATPTIAGSYSYTLSAYNTANAKTEQSRNVTVEADPTFTGFTVNGQSSINVSPNANLSFVGAGFSNGAVLQGRNNGNTSNENLPTTANATAGTTTYYASATKTLNSITRNSAVRSVNVTVVNAPTIGTITAPTAIFANSTFTASWSGTDVVNYKIRGNVAASGVSTTDVDLGTTASRSITPTAAGTYIYTITATNAAGVTTTSTDTVIVEADPTFTGFTVNSGTSISVAPSAALTFAGAGFSTESTLQGRNSANTEDSVLPPTAPTTFGTYTYYAAAEKTVNSTTRYSGLRSVVVTVSENWVSIAPTYTNWTNNGGVYSCTAWYPAASTVTINQNFTQTQNCSQNQTRTKQALEQEQYTKNIRNIGTPISESQVITVSSTRNATGTKETWIYHDTAYGSWENSGSVTSCTTWTPAASTVNSGVPFNQTRSCSQVQTRTVQQRERETTIGTIRNLGTATTVTQTITVNENQTAYGTKVEFEYTAGSTQAVCRFNPQLRFMYSEIYYNGEIVFREVDTSSQVCIIRQGFKANGYEVGPLVGSQSWSVKKL